MSPAIYYGVKPRLAGDLPADWLFSYFVKLGRYLTLL